MFKGIKTVVYGTADLEKAKQWYSQVLGAGPLFDSPVRVIFLAGTSVLVLADRTRPSDAEAGPTVYWAVDDAVASYRRLCELGAQPHADLATTAGMCSGTVRDPFGNVVGVTSKINVSEKTIEQRPSDTARGVAHFRFLAALEERPEVRGPDTLAEIFIPEEWRQAFRDPAKKQWFITQFLPPGMYYGHVACSLEAAPMGQSTDEFEHFLQAQSTIHERVRGELAHGRKRSHWMWFIFPQLKGLGYSSTSLKYGMDSLEQAHRYLAHGILGPRLTECTELVLQVQNRTASEIFGYPDDLKFRSSLTLFAPCCPPNSLFAQALDRYFSGEPDPKTLQLLGLSIEAWKQAIHSGQGQP